MSKGKVGQKFSITILVQLAHSTHFFTFMDQPIPPPPPPHQFAHPQDRNLTGPLGIAQILALYH